MSAQWITCGTCKQPTTYQGVTNGYAAWACVECHGWLVVKEHHYYGKI